jgi:heme exporter protein D
MKKIVLALMLLLLTGCVGYFGEAEKITTIEIGKEKIKTELYYEGTLSDKGKQVTDCETEIKELFPSAEAKLEANLTNPDENQRKTVETKLVLLKEIKNSLQCDFKKEGENGTLSVRFENSRALTEKLSETGEEGFNLIDVNGEQFFLRIEPEKVKDYFALKLSEENFKIKVDGEVIQVTPEKFTINQGFIRIYKTKDTNISMVEIEFMKEKKEEFPFALIAVSFIVVVLAVFIIHSVWKRREQEELFPKSEQEIKNKMKKALMDGLATTQVNITEMEKTKEGYEAEVIIKTRKYHIRFNKKMEILDYIKLKETQNE